jgi:peptide/nickel transport system permease protein
MLRHALRRLSSSLLLLWLLLTAVFFLVQLAPGSPVDFLITDPRLPRAEQARLAAVYGVDRPAVVQYVSWLGAVVRGDWGTSFVHGRPVLDVLLEALPATVLLALAGTAIEHALGIPLGVIAARRRGRISDGLLRLVSLTFYSLPYFWLSLMAILLLAIQWPAFPPSHMRSVGAAELSSAGRWLDLLHHLALPAIVLGVATAGQTIRYVRNRMIEVMEQDYIRTARAKGLSEARVVWVHGLRNALVPVIQILGITLPRALNGVVVVEIVFAWPGLGRLILQGYQSQDYPLIMAGMAFSGSLVIAGSLMADLLHALVDPRVRHPVAPAEATDG